jgi:hypothetical protein
MLAIVRYFRMHSFLGYYIIPFKWYDYVVLLIWYDYMVRLAMVRYLCTSMDVGLTTWSGHGLDVLAHVRRDLHLLLH